MRLSNFTVRILVAILVLVLVAGCRASGNRRAPIEDRDTSAKKSQVTNKKSGQNELDARSQYYVIQKGDTLYSIAFENGLDYREVAEQNNIENPAAIQIGQKIKLLPLEDGTNERSRIESHSLVPNTYTSVIKKDQPKIIKLPYSEQAVAQIEKMQQEPNQAATSTAIQIPLVKASPKENTETDDVLEWSIPTKGKVIGVYSESANRKGVDIAGIKGQAVLASAAGKVVYSGSGLRGYGKLVIIKHNKTFLSAYAHNEKILVKEGQSVTKGQQIAEMGDTDSDQVKLHFEIRQFGKPVDPAKFLNLAKF